MREVKRLFTLCKLEGRVGYLLLLAYIMIGDSGTYAEVSQKEEQVVVVSLLERNPFKVSDKVIPEKKETVLDLSELKSLEEIVEYRGSYKLNDSRKYSLLFRNSGQSRWLLSNEVFEGIRVVDSVDEYSALILEHQGNQGVIKLSKPESRRVARRQSQPTVPPRHAIPMERPGADSMRPPGMIPSNSPRFEDVPPPPSRPR